MSQHLNGSDPQIDPWGYNFEPHEYKYEQVKKDLIEAEGLKAVRD
jgi:hypothetical protein